MNKKEGWGGTKRAQQIRSVADELNYRPNLIARSLQSGRTKTLGLIVANISNPIRLMEVTLAGDKRMAKYS